MRRKEGRGVSVQLKAEAFKDTDIPCLLQDGAHLGEEDAYIWGQFSQYLCEFLDHEVPILNLG